MALAGLVPVGLDAQFNPNAAMNRNAILPSGLSAPCTTPSLPPRHCEGNSYILHLSRVACHNIEKQLFMIGHWNASPSNGVISRTNAQRT